MGLVAWNKDDDDDGAAVKVASVKQLLRPRLLILCNHFIPEGSGQVI